MLRVAFSTNALRPIPHFSGLFHQYFLEKIHSSCKVDFKVVCREHYLKIASEVVDFKVAGISGFTQIAYL
jgi:hypothetical protein